MLISKLFPLKKMSDWDARKPFEMGKPTDSKKRASKKTVTGNNKKLSAKSSKFLEKKSLYAQLVNTMQMRKLLYPKNCISISDTFAPMYPPIFFTS